MRDLLIRVLLTIAVCAALWGTLAASAYTFDFSVVWPYRGQLLRGLFWTLVATGGAYALGLVLGMAVAMARLSRWLVIRHTGDLYVEILRGTPFLVQVSIAWWGFAPLVRGLENRLIVGTLALGAFAAAYIGEIVRAGIESVDRGQFEAARSLGLSPRQTLRHVVGPQAFKRMIPPLTGELIALTKESSLLFTIGVTELMAAGNQVGANTYRTFEALLVVACLYLALTIPLSLLARRLERKLGRGERSGLDLL